MALFKICRGNESNLPDTLTDGYAYFCTDTGNFYIDWADAEANVSRKHINAEYATKLRFKDENEEWIEIDAKDLHDMLGFKQVQADWDQTDPTSFSYILNRPFGIIRDTVYQIECEFSYKTIGSTVYRTGTTSDETNPFYEFHRKMVAGETYYVIWDDTVYECLCTTTSFDDRSGYPSAVKTIGNPALGNRYYTNFSMDGEDNGYPFLISGLFDLAVEPGMHKVMIQTNESIEKLDSKYLPDDAATKEYVQEALADVDFEQVQADWKENDYTSQAYIANKPILAPVATKGTFAALKGKQFHVGDIPAFAEASFTFKEEQDDVLSGVFSANLAHNNSCWLVLGETYTVIWDGEEHTCVCASTKDLGGIWALAEKRLYLGNGAIAKELNQAPDTGEPFLIIGDESEFFAYTLNTNAKHTISITPVNDVIKLDQKYLPDGLATEQFVEDKIANIKVSGGGTVEQQIDVMPETEFAPFEQNALFGGRYVHNFEWGESSFVPQIGESYTVVWDGVEYSCVAYDTSDTVAGSVSVGNGSMFGYSSNNEPFGLVFDEYGVTLVATDGSTDESHTIRIYQSNLAGFMLPAVTEADNGKYLRVEDGKWVAADGSVGGGTVEQQVDLIPEQEVPYFSPTSKYGGLCTTANSFGALQSTLFTLKLGDECTVVWDGTEHQCVVFDASAVETGALAIGNGSGFGLSGNGEPFAIAWIDTGITFLAVDGSTEESHTVRVYQTKVSSAGGVSSWNDLTDKPFYDEEVVVFEGEFQGTKYDSDGDGVMDAWEDMMFAPYNNEDPLVVGQTYTFYWDGVKYTSECYSLMGVGAIGFNAITSEGMSAYPVAMGLDISGMMTGGTPAWIAMHAIAPTDMSHSGLHSCKIIGQETKKIDDKYQHQPDWDETDVNRASFVKNKPFGVLSKAGVLYESDVSYEANDFGFMLMDFVSEDVIIGGNYKVSVNGVSYTGVCEGAGSLEDGAITYTHLVRLNADGYSTLGLVCNPTLVEVGVTIPATLAPENLLGDTRWENGEVCHIVISAMDEIVATMPHKYLDFIESHEDIVIPKMDVEMWLDGGLLGTHIPATPEALQKVRSHDGGSIYVQYDGVEYKTKIYAGNCFGDVSVLGAEVESTGEPYVIAYDVIDAQDVWVLADVSGAYSDATSTITKSIKVWLDEQATIKHEFLDFIETTSGTETDVLAETTLEVVDAVTGPNGALSLIEWPESLALDSAQSYFIVWDGATYECVPTALMDGFAIGDPYIYGESSTTNGVPFLFMFGSASGTENCLVTTDTTSTSHIVRIYRYAPGTSKIKEEYLPEIHAEPAEIPYFDLIAMGLSDIPLDGTAVGVECDTSSLREAASKGLIKTTLRVAGLGATIDSICSMMYLREVDQYVYSAIGMFGSSPSIIEFIVTATAIQVRCVPLAGGTTTTMTDVSQEGA